MKIATDNQRDDLTNYVNANRRWHLFVRYVLFPLAAIAIFALVFYCLVNPR